MKGSDRELIRRLILDRCEESGSVVVDMMDAELIRS